MKFTGVSGIIAASHRAKDQSTHGHTYRVRAWFPYEDETDDAVPLQLQLRRALARYDHVVLPDNLRRAEDLAEEIGMGLKGCLRVDIDRPSEGFFARWERRS